MPSRLILEQLQARPAMAAMEAIQAKKTVPNISSMCLRYFLTFLISPKKSPKNFQVFGNQNGKEFCKNAEALLLHLSLSLSHFESNISSRH